MALHLSAGCSERLLIPGPLLGMTYPKYFLRESSKRHPGQRPESPQLVIFLTQKSSDYTLSLYWKMDLLTVSKSPLFGRSSFPVLVFIISF